jgi:phosphoenolpyruvate carboxylase
VDLSSTIHLLGETLGRVLRAEESVALFEVEETIRGLAKARRAGDAAAPTALAGAVAALSGDAARAAASAFAVYFDLVNIAEDAQRLEALREASGRIILPVADPRRHGGPDPSPGVLAGDAALLDALASSC